MLTLAQQQNQTQSQSQAQNQSNPSPAVDSLKKIQKTTATITAGVVYAPYLHYYGRTDNFRSSAILPTVNIEFDSIHIYASGTSVLLDNSSQPMQYAGTIAELGYRFGKFEHFSGNIYGNKFFYNTTQLPQSALEEQAGLNLSEHTKIINFTATGSAAFSQERTDFFASAGVNKIFKKVFTKSVLLVTLTYVLNMGSQNFSTVQYKNNPGVPEAILQQNRDFKILDHEFSIPVIYARKHVFFILTPSYVRPENVVTIPGFPQLSEKGKNLFYINATVLYSLKLR